MKGPEALREVILRLAHAHPDQQERICRGTIADGDDVLFEVEGVGLGHSVSFANHEPGRPEPTVAGEGGGSGANPMSRVALLSAYRYLKDYTLADAARHVIEPFPENGLTVEIHAPGCSKEYFKHEYVYAAILFGYTDGDEDAPLFIAGASPGVILNEVIDVLTAAGRELFGGGNGGGSHPLAALLGGG